MTETMKALIADGVSIMFLGMGFVFFFLILTVYCIKGTSFLIQKLNKFFPEELPVQQTQKKKKNDDAAIAVAIAAAKLASCKK